MPDAPISIVHVDTGPDCTGFRRCGIEEIKAEYERTGVDYVWYPLRGERHGPWDVEVDEKSLTDLAFDFIVSQQQDLVVD